MRMNGCKKIKLIPAEKLKKKIVKNAVSVYFKVRVYK